MKDRRNKQMEMTLQEAIAIVVGKRAAGIHLSGK